MNRDELIGSALSAIVSGLVLSATGAFIYTIKSEAESLEEANIALRARVEAAEQRLKAISSIVDPSGAITCRSIRIPTGDSTSDAFRAFRGEFGGRIEVMDPYGKTAIALSTTRDGGKVNILNDDSGTAISLSAQEHGGYIDVLGNKGYATARIQSSEAGDGQIVVYQKEADGTMSVGTRVLGGSVDAKHR